MTEPPHREQGSTDLPEHPTGTLVLVVVYGILFVVGWLVAYYGVFLPRGGVS